MRFNRKTLTLIYLVISTILGWACVYFKDTFGPLAVFPPIIFGLALVWSNKTYLKSKVASTFIPMAFFLIFFGGSPAFYSIGPWVYESKLVNNIFGSIGAFLLVILTVKLNLKDLRLGFLKILTIIGLAILSVMIDAIITNESFVKIEKKIIWDRPDLTVLIYQLFMSIAIVSTIKSNKLPEPINIKSQ